MLKIFILLLLLSGYAKCDSLSILFLGDTHFGDNYQYDPKFNRGVNIINEYGYDYFFENVKKILLTSDISFCNLETPLTKTLAPVSIKKPYLHWSDPVNTIEYLSKYNIKNVSLGNNHVFDQGITGFTETISSLQIAGMYYFGAGKNSDEALKPLVIDENGVKLVIFSGFEYRASYDTLYNFYADSIKAGVNKLDIINMNEQILNCRKKFPKAKIIIYPHWGSNYKQVNNRQIAFAHSWIDAGADIIIGHGAHTVQQIEKYNGKWIIYNIGNFIFNAPGRYRTTGAKPYGLMAMLVIEKGKDKIFLYPLFTNNKTNDYQVRELNNEEFTELEEFLLKGKFIYSVYENECFELK
ncbi:MAG TPA: CapA family protein [Ignavibacteria bacterium]|nr:CapA family protein [Ignavibacteria bacterium]HMQ97884.1 CapA family protein [Ignavibacteria bacterium]